VGAWRCQDGVWRCHGRALENTRHLCTWCRHCHTGRVLEKTRHKAAQPLNHAHHGKGRPVQRAVCAAAHPFTPRRATESESLTPRRPGRTIPGGPHRSCDRHLKMEARTSNMARSPAHPRRQCWPRVAMPGCTRRGLRQERCRGNKQMHTECSEEHLKCASSTMHAQA
jgi:hypothetical protein